MVSSVLIITSASSTIGMGHFKRCLAIADKLKVNNLQVEFGFIKDDMLEQLCLKESYSCISLIDFSYKSFENYDFILFDLLEDDLLKFDIGKLKIRYGLIYTFEPEKVIGNPEFIIWPNVHNSKVEVINNKTTLYSGLNYVILDKAFAKNRQRVHKKELKNILITMGGSDPSNFTKKCLECLNKVSKKYNLIIIVGAGYKKLDILKRVISKSKHNVKLHVDLPNIYNVSLNADFAFISGGNTRFELSYLGVPFATIAFNKKQYINNRYFEHSYKSSFNLGIGGDKSCQKLIHLLNDIENDLSILDELGQKSKSIIDIHGSERCVKIIMDNLRR